MVKKVNINSNKLWLTGVPDAAYRVSWKLVHWFRRFLKGGCSRNLAHVNQMSQTIFVPTTHRGSTQNLALIGQAILEKMFKIVNGRHQTEHGYSISSPMSLWLRWAKNQGSPDNWAAEVGLCHSKRNLIFDGGCSSSWCPGLAVSFELCHENMSLVVRKPVFGVSDRVRHKPGCAATGDG